MRLEHTCLKVYDLTRSLNFYIDLLGLKKTKTVDMKNIRQTAVYVTCPGDRWSIELLYDENRKEPYNPGDGYSHLALEVESVQKTYEEWSGRGIKFRGGPIKMTHGPTIAFLEDPDGYLIELVEPQQG